MDLGEKILAWIADERQSEVKQTWLIVVKNSWTEDDDFVIQSTQHTQLKMYQLWTDDRGWKQMKSPQNHKRSKIGEGGRENKNVRHTNEKSLSQNILWKEEQRRSLQNTVNKYTKRSSRTFICCLSLELKSRFPNWLKHINCRIHRHTHVPCRCLNWHRTFSSAGYVGFTNQTRRVQSFWTIYPDGTNHPLTTIWGNGYRQAQPQEQKWEPFQQMK